MIIFFFLSQNGTSCSAIKAIGIQDASLISVQSPPPLKGRVNDPSKFDESREKGLFKKCNYVRIVRQNDVCSSGVANAFNLWHPSPYQQCYDNLQRD